MACLPPGRLLSVWRLRQMWQAMHSTRAEPRLTWRCPPLRSLRAAAGNSSSRDVAPVTSTSQVQLPGELWHCILFLVLLDEPRTPAPWRLACVCKQWMYYRRLTFALHSFAYRMQEQHRSPEWLKAGLKPAPSAQLMLAHSCVLPGEQLRKRLRKAAAQDPVPGAKRQRS